MTLKQYQAFIAVAKQRSFSEATEQTGLSQPTLSRLIKQLEDELEVELIDRYHRPLRLTSTGEYFYEKLTNIIQELETLTQLTKKMGNPSNSLTIGFIPSILYGFLPKIISTLRLQQPQLELHLKDISSYQQIQALKNSEIDVGLGRFVLQDPKVKQILLRHERYVLAVPHNHHLANKESVHLSETVSDGLILYHQTSLPKTSENSITEPLLHIYDEIGLTPLKTVKVSDIQIALGMVIAGEGVTLVPDSLKNERTDRIAYVPLVHEDATTPIFLHTLKDLKHEKINDLLAIIYELYEENGVTYRQQWL